MNICRPVELCLIAACLCLLPVAADGSARAEEGRREEAVRLWEQALAAKGGRERLRRVRNMVVSWDEGAHTNVYVFPGKHWAWRDDRSSPIGLSVTMFDLEKDLHYLTHPDDPQSPRKLGRYGGASVPLRDAQLYFLLETEWLRPRPIGVARGKAGRRKADVVQTLVDGRELNPLLKVEQVDFYLDRETRGGLTTSSSRATRCRRASSSRASSVTSAAAGCRPPSC